MDFIAGLRELSLALFLGGLVAALLFATIGWILRGRLAFDEHADWEMEKEEAEQNISSLKYQLMSREQEMATFRERSTKELRHAAEQIKKLQELQPALKNSQAQLVRLTEENTQLQQRLRSKPAAQQVQADISSTKHKPARAQKSRRNAPAKATATAPGGNPNGVAAAKPVEDPQLLERHASLQQQYGNLVESRDKERKELQAQLHKQRRKHENLIGDFEKKSRELEISLADQRALSKRLDQQKLEINALAQRMPAIAGNNTADMSAQIVSAFTSDSDDDEFSRLNQTVEVLNAEFDKHNGQLQAVQRKNTEYKNRNAALSESLKQAQTAAARVEQEHQQSIAKLTRELQHTLDTSGEQLATQQQQVIDLQAQLDVSAEKITRQYTKSIDERNSAIIELEKQLAEKAKTVEVLQQDFDKQRQTDEQLRLDVTTLQRELSARDTRHGEVETARKESEKQQQAELKTLQSAHDKAISEHSERIKVLQNQLAEQRTLASRGQNELSTLKQDKQRLEQQQKEFRQQLESQQQRHNTELSQSAERVTAVRNSLEVQHKKNLQQATEKTSLQNQSQLQELQRKISEGEKSQQQQADANADLQKQLATSRQQLEQQQKEHQVALKASENQLRKNITTEHQKALDVLQNKVRIAEQSATDTGQQSEQLRQQIEKLHKQHQGELDARQQRSRKQAETTSEKIAELNQRLEATAGTEKALQQQIEQQQHCLLYTSPSPRDS